MPCTEFGLILLLRGCARACVWTLVMGAESRSCNVRLSWVHLCWAAVAAISGSEARMRDVSFTFASEDVCSSSLVA